ncbi:hypothetical protein SKAU_G00130170 [Synaphobranchus kaupii]|uniref:Uncharacterized protein n=1 Tax=Synaphobranchus kaupii TaxID=118154 RepID=A0A9Q1FQT2_SYNKA|nr:hypothetical protein SKAU_G00130170 [Synaphobranchus kaupii]
MPGKRNDLGRGGGLGGVSGAFDSCTDGWHGNGAPSPAEAPEQGGVPSRRGQGLSHRPTGGPGPALKVDSFKAWEALRALEPRMGIADMKSAELHYDASARLATPDTADSDRQAPPRTGEQAA